jgi:FlaA1/EpsC-like NDP-sugar epimerase
LQKLINHFNSTHQHPKICVITNGSFILNQDKNANLNASMLTGVLRTLENEHEEINFLQIDISNEIKDVEINQISNLVFADNKYKEIAVRHQSVYASTIEKTTAALKKTKQIYAYKTYLVVGGTSGLGLSTVKWLVENNAKNILVLSRRGAKAETKSLFEKYKSDGVFINDVMADVMHMDSLQDVLSSAPNIAGIFYAAGILDDGALKT